MFLKSILISSVVLYSVISATEHNHTNLESEADTCLAKIVSKSSISKDFIKDHLDFMIPAATHNLHKKANDDPHLDFKTLALKSMNNARTFQNHSFKAFIKTSNSLFKSYKNPSQKKAIFLLLERVNNKVVNYFGELNYVSNILNDSNLEPLSQNKDNKSLASQKQGSIHKNHRKSIDNSYQRDKPEA